RPKQRALAAYYYNLFESEAKSQFAHLRESVIYNDANDYNVLTNQGQVNGLIDFGDLVYSHSINDLAITIAYAAMDKDDPLATAIQITKGFNKVFPLQEAELRALFPLICIRLLVSVTVAAINRRDHPDNAYLFVSEKPAWQLLEQFRQVAPAFAHYAFRQISGWEPCPQRKRYDDWLGSAKASLHPLVKFE
ncbi:MAG: phosphotransferase, partial [Bacteroidota bacterium]